jgi:hypothetical protein
MVMVLSEHNEIVWNHKSGKAFCDGCHTDLCDLTEESNVQHWRLREHQADMLLEAGLGLTRPAEAEAWEVGMEMGIDFACNQSTPSGISIDPPLNPYLED